LVCACLCEQLICLLIFLISFQSSNMPLYTPSVVSQEVPPTPPFIVFTFGLTIKSIQELVGASLVGRFPVTYMPCITLVLKCHVIYKLSWVASLTCVQPCTYRHAMLIKRCAIKRKQSFLQELYNKDKSSRGTLILMLHEVFKP
jgi:hypothetical protein